MIIREPGIYSGIHMSDYVNDNLCEWMTVNRGTLHTITSRTAAHAYNEHPRINKNRESSSRADLGSAVHDMGLENGANIVWIDACDYKASLPKQQRDDAYAAGKIPMLLKHAEQVAGAASSVKKALSNLGRGHVEQTLVWKEGDVWCRSRADWISEDRNLVVDLKTTGNADPLTWIRSSLYSGAYDMQAMHSLRGLDFILGYGARDFYFLLAEIEPPYLTSMVCLGPEAQSMAERRLKTGVRIWSECMKNNRWPGYDDRVHAADLPSYMAYDFETRGIDS